MVIHEGDEPLSRDDVYMRDQAGRISSESARPGNERTQSEELLNELLTAE